MIVKWPGKVQANTVTDHISAQWDLMATFADITGNKANADSNGISFLPTLLGQQENQQQHQHLYWEFWEKGGRQAVRIGDWKGVRLKTRNNPEAPIELYNLALDPAEQQDIAKEHPEVIEKIKLAMQDRVRSAKARWNLVVKESN